ncbi:MAG: hypothetical protein CMJ49_05755 [Planctomycetaceae bacterium]|nr:hypothetical protein [Planctomycetaceae bacterium]
MKLNWVRTVYGDGRGWHVGSLVEWRGAYFLSFVNGTGHCTEDSQIVVGRSMDLETWTFAVVIEPPCIDPKLMVVGDRLCVYAVKAELGLEQAGHRVFPSWQMMASSDDGQKWSTPARCYMKNRDFWQPVAYGGRYWVVADTAGHVEQGGYCGSDLLVSDDGRHWSWVSELLAGGREYEDAASGERFATCSSSESALHFFEDGRLLAVTRAREHSAVLSIAEPPYDRWVHRRNRGAYCSGAAMCRIGDRIIVTGRSIEGDAPREASGPFADEKGCHTGVLFYENDDLNLKLLLPGGGDTGYAAILEAGDNEALIAYYSDHEHHDPPGSNVYLASVSLDD